MEPRRNPTKNGLDSEFDQICATEDDFDFCIVEVSTDKGGSLTEIARYDGGDDPGWSDGVGDPTDYRHASLDLSPFWNHYLLVRFRLESDELLSYDGWFLDNVHVNDANCTPLLSVEPPPAPRELSFAHASPNPGRGEVRFVFQLPERQRGVEVVVYDVAGRELRRDRLGTLEAGEHPWTWNGRDGSGRAIASGNYFAQLTQKAAWLAN